MFVNVVEFELKRKSKGSKKEIEVYSCVAFGRESFHYRYAGEEFDRPIKKGYKIMLHHSYRQDGKIKKLSLCVARIKYSDVLDNYYPDLWNLEKNLIEKGFPYESLEEVEAMIYKKIDEIWNKIEEEVKITEEYQWIQKRDKIIKEHKQRESEFNKKYDGDYYNYFYDVFGVLRKPEDLEKFKRDVEDKKRQQEEYARKSWEQAQNNYKNHGFNYQSLGVSGGSFNSDETEMVRSIISAGFKQMSKKLHPDLGGDEDQMKLLNVVKEKLDSFYGR